MKVWGRDVFCFIGHSRIFPKVSGLCHGEVNRSALLSAAINCSVLDSYSLLCDPSPGKEQNFERFAGHTVSHKSQWGLPVSSKCYICSEKLVETIPKKPKNWKFAISRKIPILGFRGHLKNFLGFPSAAWTYSIDFGKFRPI